MTQNQNTYPRTTADLAAETKVDAALAKENRPGLAGDLAALSVVSAATNSEEAQTLPTVAETQAGHTYPRTTADLAAEARFDAREARERQPGLAGEVAALAIVGAAANSPEAATLPTAAEVSGQVNHNAQQERRAA